MSTSAWRLKKRKATLKLQGFAAGVDLLRPGEGLVDIRVAGRPLAETGLLGIALPAFDVDNRVDNRNSLIERYARGPDLVAAYRESESWPVRVDAMWRAVGTAGSDGVSATIDLVVSVRTSLLDSRPQLVVQSTMIADEVWRLIDGNSTRLEKLAAADSPLSIRPDGGRSCLVFRPPGCDLSYAEMVYPADFRRDEVIWGADLPRSVRVCHRLFPDTLEKGVIHRSRVRGLFVPRSDDVQLVGRCFAEFASAELPLST